MNTSREWMLSHPIIEFQKLFVLGEGEVFDSHTALLNRIASWIDAYVRAQSLQHKLTYNQVMKYQQLHTTRAAIRSLYK